MIELSRNVLGVLRFYGSLAAMLGAIFFSPGLSAANASSEPINAESAAPRIEALRREIAHHDELYYKKAAPEISDAAYDRLKQTLAALEQKFPAAAAGESPSESLGIASACSASKKVTANPTCGRFTRDSRSACAAPNSFL